MLTEMSTKEPLRKRWAIQHRTSSAIYSTSQFSEASAFSNASAAFKRQQGTGNSSSANLAFANSRPAPQDRDSLRFGLLIVRLCETQGNCVFRRWRCLQTIGGGQWFYVSETQFVVENHCFLKRQNQKTPKISLHSGRNGPRMISGPHPPASAPPTLFACGSLSLSLSLLLLLALGVASVAPGAGSNLNRERAIHHRTPCAH